MWVRLTRQRTLGYNEDLPESNKRKPHSGREAVGMQTQFAGPTNANDGLAVSTARIASLTES